MPFTGSFIGINFISLSNSKLRKINLGLGKKTPKVGRKKPNKHFTNVFSIISW
jgi:hypothetical protein